MSVKCLFSPLNRQGIKHAWAFRETNAPAMDTFSSSMTYTEVPHTQSSTRPGFEPMTPMRRS